MLKFGIESHLPDNEVFVSDSDDEIFILPDHPVTTQKKRKGTKQIFSLTMAMQKVII